MRTPRFEIFQSPKDQLFYFRLKAKNGKIILSSEGYTAKHNAEHCIEIFTHDPFFILKGPHAIHCYWWFHGRAFNEEIIGKSQMYKSKSSARKGIESCRRCAPIAELVDLTRDI